MTCLFLDIGGVLLTDGGNREARQASADRFKLELRELEDRHHVTFDTYEVGKLVLAGYLDRIVFHRKRPFTRAKFLELMLARSKPFSEMIDLVCRLKAKYKLKIAVVSNEGRELILHRLHKFKLNGFVDFLISACFVHVRKPDGTFTGWRLTWRRCPAIRLFILKTGPCSCRWRRRLAFAASGTRIFKRPERGSRNLG